MGTRGCVQEHCVAAHGTTVLSTQFSVSVELWRSFRNKENSIYTVATLQSLLFL
jgi:hypothetical protein